MNVSLRGLSYISRVLAAFAAIALSAHAVAGGLDSAVLAVCDGMGGESHGELASLETARTLRLCAARGSVDMEDVTAQANEKVCELITMYGGSRSGTTLAGLVMDQSRVRITNIGDSRAYLCRNGALRTLSRDDTVIQQMLDMGIITPEQAKTHSARHRITQHIGIFPEEMIIEPHTTEEVPRPGDLYLLCSDGLTDMVGDSMIGQILGARGSYVKKAEALFKTAMYNGGRDNCTVLIAEVV